MKIKNIMLSSFTVIFGCSDSNFERIELETKNPTEYIFNASLTKVKSAIQLEFDHHNFKRMNIAFKGSFYPDSTKLFDQPGNEDDYCLYSNLNSIGKSRIFYKGSEFLEYFADFHLHLDQIGVESTRIEIITLNPRIIIGREILPNIHAVRPDKYHDVKPSTIEEYEILLKIGKAIGQEDMPELIMPDM